ncbi:MAG: T9SS type A sorting domain-containing protein, partial [Prevotellaceae bacterium]|nr:T9SS type A sorting domain-containing protein [Prevotellaceae bacterium]
ATLTITPDSGQTKVYGDSDPVLTFSVSGWQRGDESDSANIIKGALNRDPGDTVATYYIKNDGGAPVSAGSNYEVKFIENKTFSITRASQSIAFNPPTLINIREGSYILKATASSGLTPIFRITAGNSLVELDGDTLLLKQAGDIIVEAYLLPNPNYYDAEEVAKKITIEKRSSNNNVMDINVINASKAPDTSSANAEGYRYWITDKPDAGLLSSGSILEIVIATADPYAKVIIGGDTFCQSASFTYHVDRGGMYRIPFAVEAEDGTMRNDTITVECYLNFSYYTRVKWDNTMFISVGLLEEREYEVFSCSWYGDDRLLATGPSFSMGDNLEHVMKPGVNYYFVLETSEGVIRSTSRIFEETVPGGFRIHPTIIRHYAGETLYVNANSQSSGEERGRNGVTIYNINGAIVYEEPLLNGRAELTKISSLDPGIYIIKVKNWQTKIVVQ